MPQTTEHIANIGGKSISYRLNSSVRARRLRISVSVNGVTVTLPAGIPPAEAEKFLQQNAPWVIDQLARVEKAARRSRRLILPEDVILLRGEPVQIVVVEEPDRKTRLRVDELKGRLIVYAPPGLRVKLRQLVEPWLKSLARDEIEKVVKQQAARMGAIPKSITIRDQRTRWGSCSSRGTLSFNWRLVMAPPVVLEYVVIHELAHMFQPNHSVAFWAVVAKYSPSFKTCRTWLRKNAHALRADGG